MEYPLCHSLTAVSPVCRYTGPGKRTNLCIVAVSPVCRYTRGNTFLHVPGKATYCHLSTRVCVFFLQRGSNRKVNTPGADCWAIHSAEVEATGQERPAWTLVSGQVQAGMPAPDRSVKASCCNRRHRVAARGPPGSPRRGWAPGTLHQQPATSNQQ